MNILVVTSSALGDASVSSRLAHDFAAKAAAAATSATITVRDVGAEPSPHLTQATVSAIRGEATTDAERETLALSDTLIAELRAADLVVIGSPMYNFGISSTLKTWFDHVLRARVTFQYTDNGPEGLLGGRRVVVVESRAGDYPPGTPNDSQEPHLRTMLGFMGLTDVTFVRVERLAFGPDASAAAIAAAESTLADLAARRPDAIAA